MALTVFGQLDRSLHDHLAALVRRADQADGESAVELARSELPRVVAALKSLLDEHQPDERGRCGTCRRRWSGLWGRRSTAPCRAYIGAQLCLAVAGPRPVAGSRDEVDPFEDGVGDPFGDTFRDAGR
ncbi:hypothetical protein KCV87_27525 [Actinosynnema pretiosum subsp. pretiosum]|uniref:Uncharacterized protein n=2 Tax=Actinosynnema TaxID=40566 RepID=C6WCA8_ACTMD|nr:hypothetical protein [Actinosynnema mirum]ACU39496.1 hypothetical protein Amir_5681 [Actinosynnema mirum DSM 43827]AXX33000.1 hypothetical protein APASM_5635 [Actinosynnema pretiosum subsp. pretiosum]QUF03140.1 hypothetical protein KCV87_27525 [Actinosynnema pretiosum subsp. pretiosum]